MLWDLLQLKLITVSLVLRDLQRFDSVWLVIVYTVRVLYMVLVSQYIDYDYLT